MNDSTTLIVGDLRIGFENALNEVPELTKLQRIQLTIIGMELCKAAIDRAFRLLVAEAANAQTSN